MLQFKDFVLHFYLFYYKTSDVILGNCGWSVMTAGGCVCEEKFAMTTGTSVWKQMNGPGTSTTN